MQNGMVESLNGKTRDEFLNEQWFYTLKDAQEQSRRFKEEFNTEREHSALAGLTPFEFKLKMTPTISRLVG